MARNSILGIRISMTWAGVASILACSLAAQPPAAPPKPVRAQPSFDPALVESGRELYRPNCGFCHGADARGAEGPDLARSLVVLGDDDGKELGAFLRAGRPDAGMPAFSALTAEQAKQIATFLHSRIAESRRRAAMNPNEVVVGDARAGEAFFKGAGQCSSCHNPAAEFKGIGAKYDPSILQSRVVNPRGGRGGPPIKPSTVRITLPTGAVLTGRLVQVSDFFVTYVDTQGVRRTVTRSNGVPKVEVADPYKAHYDRFLKWTDKDLHDVTAYLVTLK